MKKYSILGPVIVIIFMVVNNTSFVKEGLKFYVNICLFAASVSVFLYFIFKEKGAWLKTRGNAWAWILVVSLLVSISLCCYYIFGRQTA
jgi:hypothetical protein